MSKAEQLISQLIEGGYKRVGGKLTGDPPSEIELLKDKPPKFKKGDILVYSEKLSTGKMGMNFYTLKGDSSKVYKFIDDESILIDQTNKKIKIIKW